MTSGSQCQSLEQDETLFRNIHTNKIFYTNIYSILGGVHHNTDSPSTIFLFVLI